MEFVAIVFLVAAVAWLFLRKSPSAEAEKQKSSAPMPRYDSEPRVTILSLQSETSVLEKSATEFDLTLEPKPKKETAEIRSSDYESEIKYQVNLIDQTCTCSDFSARSCRPKNHFSRWCKHLIKALDRDGAFEGIDEWQRAIVDDGHGGPKIAYMIARDAASPALITVGSSDEWINVYARKKKKGEKVSEASGSIARYGWSISQQRWSYGDGPDGAREIKKMLKVIEDVKA